MQITEVRLNKLTGDGKAKAVASVTFDGEFAVHGINVFDGAKGLFVTMPSRKKGEEFVDIAHPVKADFRQKLIDAVLAEYNK